MLRPFRFGVIMISPAPRAAWREKCRRAERLGYDVLLVPDHLGMPAPFPALVAAGEATERPRLGTFVLNAGFWNPALLAREVADTDALTDGRLELGLGTGYVKAEHDTAGLPFGSPRERVDHLEHVVTEVDRLLRDPEHQPRHAQTPRPPLALGGNGDRLLRLAARHADVVAFTGAEQAPGEPAGTLRLASAHTLQARVAAYHRFASEVGRTTPAELNYLVQMVEITDDRRAAVRSYAPPGPTLVPVLTEDELLDHPAVLVGSVKEMAEQLRAHRERYGFSYFVVLDPFMEPFAEVIEELRGE
ncbi:LLM class F420-dependent oxidoreductase [Streptomyces sp. LX-29]|uniref:LLM class F420-dependent oxidoreductase n=1 Tax=Streptomyces sp. LX-29 TaxID=2900152 RepID=UPI00240E15F9|nr:LLM class F420-dependent oxidoreductase [Streptomyces sp. LX-29]WFB06192.1 LLM class F420-dependent oxidoreductase [Streptomyces sp. LX-29]